MPTYTFLACRMHGNVEVAVYLDSVEKLTGTLAIEDCKTAQVSSSPTATSKDPSTSASGNVNIPHDAINIQVKDGSCCGLKHEAGGAMKRAQHVIWA